MSHLDERSAVEMDSQLFEGIQILWIRSFRTLWRTAKPNENDVQPYYVVNCATPPESPYTTAELLPFACCFYS